MDIRRRAQIGGIKKTSSGGGSTVGSYTVNLNSQWEKTTAVSNPDSSLYDGVYRSSSNYNVNSGVATMYITIKDCSSFKMYIRSYAESCCDYVMVSQLDKTITGNSSYSDTTLVKAHTKGNQQSSTALSNYTLVEFTGISAGEHTITVVYRKDSSVNRGDDRGYVLIEKSQAGIGDSGGDDEGGSNEGPINIDNYLTIEALEDGLTASLSTKACEYCVDGDGNWKTLSAGTATKSINVGQTLSFRGELSTSSSSNGIGTFTISKKCNLLGNCMSMLFGNNASSNFSLSGKSYAFYKLFQNCTNIITVCNNFLPATTLASSCYRYMFQGCTSLTTTPELPATTLASSCYQYMFSDCKSLTTAPELPATTLVNNCYDYMFWGCSALTVAPELPATTLADYCYSSMFLDCKSLTTVPAVLPATTLAYGCYYRMFGDCTLLTAAPELPATTLTRDCYECMFQNCTSLTTAPELPATTLADGCYERMFNGCTGLTTAPELPATTLAPSCYYNMFYGCSSLTAAPTLSATTLASNCYRYMFYKCTSLTTAPAVLPATTLADYCYAAMFSDCKSLTTAPELPATTLASNCYANMFYSCRKLNYIKMLATDISASNCLNYWVYYVSSTGTFVKNSAMTTLPTGYSGTPSEWIVVNDGEDEGAINIDNYLTIQALEDGLTASLSKGCQYCVDGDGNWKTLEAGIATESINSGHTLSFRGKLTPSSSEGIGTFTISKKCNLKGNCMSMLFGNNAADNYSLSGKDFAFARLFENCVNIVNVSSDFLPATTLATYCYRSMFSGCSSLTTTPTLSATTLADHCYAAMFASCTGLTTAPELPATTLTVGCYNTMFSGCTRLTTVPELPATILVDDCYEFMFSNCTSLTTAPELHATTLVKNCYYGMFQKCNKLKYIKMLATDISASQCLHYWVWDVASTGTFVKNSAMTTLPTATINNDYEGIPRGWTVVDEE